MSGAAGTAVFSMLAVAVLYMAPAQAQVLDRIEVFPASKGESEVVLWFQRDVEYLRSVPANAGKSVRLYFRAMATGEGSGMREVLRSPALSGLPAFLVSYPEVDGSVSFSFEASVSFRIIQARGPRNVSVFARATEARVAAPAAELAAGVRQSVEPRLVSGQPEIVLLPVPAPAPPAAPPPTAESPLTPPPSLPPAPQAAPADMKEALERARQASQESLDPLGAVPLGRVEEATRILLANGKRALAANDLPLALRNLSQILNLPSSSATREAQELMGVVRERSGEFSKARGEYELFLTLYPDGEDSVRVRARLTQLGTGTPTIAGQPAPPRADDQPWTISGGLSQNYYSGNSHIEILTPPPPGLVTFNQQSLSQTDQSSIVSSIDFTARKRSDGRETRVVFRDMATTNFLPGQKNLNRLTTAYLEQSDRTAGYLYRLGRHSGSFGTIGLIDGASGSYQINPNYKVNASFGSPS